MKFIIRNTVINGFALNLLPSLLGGVKVHGGILTLVLGGFLLTLMLSVLKPILNIIRFPLNFLTLGLFSLLTNAFILYVLTVFVPTISISAFTSPRLAVGGFAFPSFHFNVFAAYAVSALILLLIVYFIDWLLE